MAPSGSIVWSLVVRELPEGSDIVWQQASVLTPSAPSPRVFDESWLHADAGAVAFKAGLPLSADPHKAGSSSSSHWRQGWRAAQAPRPAARKVGLARPALHRRPPVEVEEYAIR